MSTQPTIITHERSVNLIVANPFTGQILSNIFISRDDHCLGTGTIEAEDGATGDSITLYVRSFIDTTGHIPSEYSREFLSKLQGELDVRFTDVDATGCPIVYSRLCGILENRILKK